VSPQGLRRRNVEILMNLHKSSMSIVGWKPFAHSLAQSSPLLAFFPYRKLSNALVLGRRDPSINHSVRRGTCSHPPKRYLCLHLQAYLFYPLVISLYRDIYDQHPVICKYHSDDWGEISADNLFDVGPPVTTPSPISRNKGGTADLASRLRVVQEVDGDGVWEICVELFFCLIE
jgi:hypothetical protein